MQAKLPGSGGWHQDATPGPHGPESENVEQTARAALKESLAERRAKLQRARKSRQAPPARPATGRETPDSDASRSLAAAIEKPQHSDARENSMLHSGLIHGSMPSLQVEPDEVIRLYEMYKSAVNLGHIEPSALIDFEREHHQILGQVSSIAG